MTAKKDEARLTRPGRKKDSRKTCGRKDTLPFVATQQQFQRGAFSAHYPLTAPGQRGRRG